MNFSARTLAVVLLVSSLTSGCFNSSEKHEWQVEPQGTQSQFPVPQKVQEKVEIENLRAEVSLNNGEDWQPLVIDGVTATGSITGLEAGQYTISIRFRYISGIYGPLTLAQATKNVTIVAGTKTTLEVLETDYDLSLFDSDRDGLSNADEISLGTNPLDSSDPGNVRPSSTSSVTPSSDSSSSQASSELLPSSASDSSASSISSDTPSSLSSSSDSGNNGTPIIISIDAGTDVIVDEGEPVTLQGTAELSNGTPTYLWEYIGAEPFSELLTGANTDTVSFTTGNYLQDVTFDFRLTVAVGDQSLTDTVSVMVRADNDAPVVSFFPAQITAEPNDSIDLIPNQHQDPEGASLTYRWRQLSGDTVQVPLAVSNENANLIAPQLQAPNQPITLNYELTVSDGVNQSSARVAVIVTDINEPPLARINTADDQSIFVENTQVVLSAEDSTDDYTPLSRLKFQWELETDLPYDLGITDWQSRELTFTAPNLAVDQDLRFSLIVTDDSTPALSSTQTFVNITIDAENNPAVLTLGRSAGSAEPGEQGIELTVTAIDPDLDQAGLTYTFEWQNPVGFEVLNATTGEQVTFDAPSDLLEDTNLEFTVNATQVGTGALPIVSDSISVLIGGFAPPTAVAAFANAMVTPSESAAFNVTAAGSLNGTNPIASYSWATSCDGNLANATAAVATFTPNNRAANDVCNFTVEISDGSVEGTASDTLDVTIMATDEPPVLEPFATINTTANQLVSLDASAANDPENTPLTFSWSTTSGIALTNADTAIASFTAPDSDEAQTLSFTVTVADGNPDNDLVRSVDVEVAANNAAPTAVITPLPGDSVAEKTPVTLSGETSSDTHTASTALQYQWAQLSPTVAELNLGITDWQSATLSFTSPDLAADQVVTFGLIVTDSQGEPSTQDSYALTIEGDNNAPTVEVIASQNAVAAGATVTLTATASNSDSDQQAIGYTYSWKAPAGFESLLAGFSAAELASNEIVVTMPTDLSADVTPLVFTVTATEDITDGLTSESAQTTITVGQGYVPPVAGIALVGGGSTITEGVAATFSAASSQLGTDVPVTYSWSTDCPGAFDSTSGVQVSFTGDNLAASISCEVIVSIDDNSGNAAVPVSARLPVTLSANNDAPVTTGPAAPIDAIARMPVALEGFTVSDVDTDQAELTYEWTADVAGAEAWLSDTAALAPTLLAPPSPEDVQVIYTLRAIDGGEAERTAAENATAVASVTVNIANNNDNPRAAIRLDMPASVTDIAENLAVNLVAEPVAGATRFDNFSDANELTFTWTPSAELQALGAMPASATGLDAYSFSLPNLEQPLADMNVSLVVRDPNGGISSTYDFPFAIKAENDAPSVELAVSPQTASENQTVTFTATAEDPEQIRTLSYSWQQVDADGNPVAADFEPQVSCTTPATAECSFQAPFVQEDTPIYMAVTVSEEGAEPFLKQTTSIASVTVASGYVAWVLELQASAAPREGEPLSISINTLTEGTSQIANYDWTASSCLDVDFSTEVGANADTLNIALPSGQKVGYACDISLVVTDGANQTADAELNLTVEANDDVPVAVIADRSLTITGYNVNGEDTTDERLDGSLSSDDENDTLVYVWEQDPADTVQVQWRQLGEDSGIAFFIVPEQAEETLLNFTLTVCDAPNDPARCDATPETITLTVSPTNYPPVAQIQVSDAVFDQANGRYVAQETEHPSQREAGEGEVRVTLLGEGSSDPAPSNGQLNYAWTIALDNSETPLDLQGAADLTEWAQTHLQIAPTDWASSSLQLTTPNLLVSRTFIFELTVTDGELPSAPEQVKIYIEADNDAPVVTANSDVGTAGVGSPINLSAAAVEPDYEQANDTLAYLWVVDIEEINFGGNQNLAALQVVAPELASEQTATFKITVTNGTETDGPAGVATIAVAIRQGYFPPEITSLVSDVDTFTEDDVVTLTATIEGNTAELTSITWQTTDCVGAEITPFNSMGADVANGSKDGRSARVQLPNRVEATYSCEITVEVVDSNDPAGTDSRAITLTDIVAGDDAPEITNVTAVMLPGNPDDTFVTGELVADIRDPEQLLGSFEWSQIPADGDAVISVSVNWVNGSNTGTAADLNAGRTTARFTLGSAQPVDVKLQFAITAADDSNVTTVNTQLLTLDNTNTAPYAGENSSQTVNESELNAEGELVPSVATISPVDINSALDDFTANGDLEFTWVPDPTAQAVLNIGELDLTQSTLSFTVPNLETGTGADQDIADLSFTLIVNDGQLTAQSVHTVSITADPDQPVITSITDSVTVDAGQPASLSVAAIDPEGKTLNYQWREVGSAGAADDRFTNATSAQATFTPETDAPADVTYNLEVLVWETGNSIDQAVVAGPVTVVANTLYSPPVIALTQQTLAPEENMPVIFQAVVSLDERATNPTFTWAASCLGDEVAVTENSRTTNAAGDVVIEASFQAPNDQRLPFTCGISLTVDDQVIAGAEPVVQSETGISVDANDDAPSVTVPVGLVVPSGMVGMPYSLDALALVDENGEQIVADSDTPLDELTYTWRVENEYPDVIVTTEGSVMNVQWPTNRFEVNSLVTFYLDVADATTPVVMPAGQSIDITVTAVNNPPVAVISELTADNTLVDLATSNDADPGNASLAETPSQQSVASTLTLSGANSIDDFSTSNKTYKWTVGLTSSERESYGLAENQLSDESITFTAPNLIEPTSFEVQLLVIDHNGNPSSSTASLIVNVSADNEAPSEPVIEGPSEAVGNNAITLTASGSTDPEGLPVTYSWQEIDALGNAVVGGVSCESTTPTTCTFTAPDEDRTLIMQVIASDGVEQSVNSISIALTQRYEPWDFELVITSPAPVEQPDFDAIEEQTEIVVALETVVEGSDAIQVYDWSASTCSYTAPTGQPITIAPVNDFSVFTDSAELSFAPVTFLAQSYQCSIQLTINDGRGEPVSKSVNVDIFADNDPATAVAGVLINSIATEVESLTQNAGAVINLTAVQASDADTVLRQGDIWWQIVEPEYESLFDFQSEASEDTTLTVPPIPEGAQVTIRLTVGGVFDDIALTVNPSDIEDPIASAELVTASVLDNSTGVQIRSTSTDDTGLETYLWSSNTPEISFTTNDQAVGVFDVTGMPLGGVATITLTVTDLAGKTASVNVPVAVEPSYVAWEFELVATPSNPDEEQDVTVEMNVLTEGTKPIAEYNWSESICNDPFSGGTYPVTSNFDGFENSLVFTLLNRVTDYTCELKLIVTEEDLGGVPGAVIESPMLLLNVSADDDPARMVIATLVGGEPVAVDTPINVNSGDSIVLDASLSRDDTNFASYDWSISDDTNSLFDFDINTPNRQVTLDIPIIPEGGEFTIQLQANRGAATATLIVASLPEQDPLSFVSAQGAAITGNGSHIADVISGDQTFTLSAVGGSGDGSVTYASSDENIAYVNSVTGRVIPRAAGTAVITATKAGDDEFQDITARYSVSVNGYIGGKAITNEFQLRLDFGVQAGAALEPNVGPGGADLRNILAVNQNHLFVNDFGSGEIAIYRIDDSSVSEVSRYTPPFAASHEEFVEASNDWLFLLGGTEYDLVDISNIGSPVSLASGSIPVGSSQTIAQFESGSLFLNGGGVGHYVDDISSLAISNSFKIFDAETWNQQFDGRRVQSLSRSGNDCEILTINNDATSQFAGVLNDCSFIYEMGSGLAFSGGNNTAGTLVHRVSGNQVGEVATVIPVEPYFTPASVQQPPIRAINGYLYVVSQDQRFNYSLDVWDIRDLAQVEQVAEYRGVSKIFRNVDGVVMVDPMSTGITRIQESGVQLFEDEGEAYLDGVKTYQVQWASFAGERVVCEVSEGECFVSNIDLTNRTAEVNWITTHFDAAPGDDLEIVVAVGSDSFYAAARDRITLKIDNRVGNSTNIPAAPGGLTVGGTFNIGATTNSGGTLQYFSRDESIAQVVSSTGLVSLVGEGSTEIVVLNTGGSGKSNWSSFLISVAVPVAASIIDPPTQIFDASFAFDIEASVMGASADTNFEWVASNVNWAAGHDNITFEDVQLSADGNTVTAKMRVSESALNGIDRSTRDNDPEKVRVVNLDLQVDGQSVLNQPAEMDIVLPFVTVWDTSIVQAESIHANDSATLSTTQLQIPVDLNDYTYNYIIDWGDGSEPEELQSHAFHDYGASGVYQVKIIGEYPHFSSKDIDLGSDAIKLIDVARWGDQSWVSMYESFRNCENLVAFSAGDTPDLSGVIDMSWMFDSAVNFNGDISEWDVSALENATFMFSYALSFNSNISSWDTPSLTNMRGMFSSAEAFNQDITGWDVSSVTDMGLLFSNALLFDQNLGGWDISSVGPPNSFGGGSMVNMLQWAGLSVENYDATLEGWANQADAPTDIVLFSAGLQYSSEGKVWRDQLVAKGWNIINDSQVFGISNVPTDALVGDKFTLDVTGGSGSAVFTSLTPDIAQIDPVSGELRLLEEGIARVEVAEADKSAEVNFEVIKFDGAQSVRLGNNILTGGDALYKASNQLLHGRGEVVNIVAEADVIYVAFQNEVAVFQLQPDGQLVESTFGLEFGDVISQLEVENGVVYISWEDSAAGVGVYAWQGALTGFELLGTVNIAAQKIHVWDGNLYVQEGENWFDRTLAVFENASRFPNTALPVFSTTLISSPDAIFNDDNYLYIKYHAPAVATRLGIFEPTFSTGVLFLSPVAEGEVGGMFNSIAPEFEVYNRVVYAQSSLGGQSVFPFVTDGFSPAGQAIAPGIDGRVTEIKRMGSKLFVYASKALAEGGVPVIYELDISVASEPVVSGIYTLDTQPAERVEAQHMVLSGEKIVINHGNSLISVDLAGGGELNRQYGEVERGQVLTYQFSWDADNVSDVQCLLKDLDGTAGACRVENIDTAAKTADVIWDLPSQEGIDNPNGHFEIMVLAGNESYLVSGKDRVRFVAP